MHGPEDHHAREGSHGHADRHGDDAPLASFEAKWTAAYPELALALGFVPVARRTARSAFACIGHELEHAAYGIREAQPAALKLQWWAEEFARARRGEARHPLTRALAGDARFAEVALDEWHAAIIGAHAQRDPEPAADKDALLRGYEALQAPLARIESILFGPLDAAARARARAVSRALRETASLGDALRDGRLPLPLDVLAKHRLSRGDLAHDAPPRRAALREWLRALRSSIDALAWRDAGVPGAASASADRWRIAQAAAAPDAAIALPPLLGRLPLRTTLACWRAARKS
jgi:phytoene synthase